MRKRGGKRKQLVPRMGKRDKSRSPGVRVEALLLQAWFRLGTVVASIWARLYCSRAAKVPPQYYLVTTPTYYLLTVIPLSIRPSYPKSTFLSLPRDRVSMINLVGPGFNPNPYFTGSAMQVNLDLTGRWSTSHHGQSILLTYLTSHACRSKRFSTIGKATTTDCSGCGSLILNGGTVFSRQALAMSLDGRPPALAAAISALVSVAPGKAVDDQLANNHLVISLPPSSHYTGTPIHSGTLLRRSRLPGADCDLRTVVDSVVTSDSTVLIRNHGTPWHDIAQGYISGVILWRPADQHHLHRALPQIRSQADGGLKLLGFRGMAGRYHKNTRQAPRSEGLISQRAIWGGEVDSSQANHHLATQTTCTSEIDRCEHPLDQDTTSTSVGGPMRRLYHWMWCCSRKFHSSRIRDPLYGPQPVPGGLTRKMQHTQVTAITGISEYIIVSSKSSWEECLIVIAVVHLPYPQRLRNVTAVLSLTRKTVAHYANEAARDLPISQQCRKGDCLLFSPSRDNRDNRGTACWGSAIAAWLFAPSPRSRGHLSDLGF
ncbi:hypothetical protein An04g05610 [Aspergillus niger]|uniref:Uncharacterized protein n=2 Tax=Aspergillus niger TaxID=5061 RepID=A2QJ29_ASPNC|nr:hypothetical protein An04g05610 [Aspergillus niger]CAK38823.1 hypothetical protein An04g05610 [Aspergillus niger]